jgi:predicted porin
MVEMKKSLLALALLVAFAGAASAQSSVTIYGVVDLGVVKSNGGTAGNNGGQAGNCGTTSNNGLAVNQLNTCKAWTIQAARTSRIGFRGNEDLGDGLSAQFQIEHRFNLDTGAQNNAGAFWQGISYVQLTSAAAGSVFLGRVPDSVYWIATKIDPFGWDGVGQWGTRMYSGFRDPNPLTTAAGKTIIDNVRQDNTVGYKTPVFSGLTAQVAIGLGEATVARTDTFNVEYAVGPLYAGLAYERAKGAGSLSATDGNAHDGDTLWALAASFDFDVVKPILYYSRSHVELTHLNTKFFGLGALAPIGPGKLKAGYYRLDPDGANNTESKFSLGYDYNLSKRTAIYADYGLTKKDLLTNNSTFSFGLRHTF